MKTGNGFLVGIYDEDHTLLHAVKNLRAQGVKIHEVYSPYPVHGLDEALGYKPSRLPIVSFFFGAAGTIIALVMQIWMLGYDWPMIIGGKNFASLPPFVPVTFELTVLLGALGMVATFFVVSDMKPYKWPLQFDRRSTNDKHVMAIGLSENKLDRQTIEAALRQEGAEEVNYKEQ